MLHLYNLIPLLIDCFAPIPRPQVLLGILSQRNTPVLLFIRSIQLLIAIQIFASQGSKIDCAFIFIFVDTRSTLFLNAHNFADSALNKVESIFDIEIVIVA